MIGVGCENARVLIAGSRDIVRCENADVGLLAVWCAVDAS